MPNWRVAKSLKRRLLVEGEIFKAGLFSKMLRFAKPYKFYFLGALLLAILGVSFELTVPIITSHIVDTNITARYHIIESEKYTYLADEKNSPFIKLSQNVIALRHDKLERVTKATLEKLKKDGEYSEELYFITKTTTEILNTPPALSQRVGGWTVVRIEDLDKLTRSEIVILRKTDLIQVVYLGLVIIALIVFSFILTYIEILLITHAGQSVIHDMRIALYSHVVHLPMKYFDTHKSGKTVTRLTNDINNIEEFFTSVFITIFKDITILTGIVSVLLILDFKLGLVTLLLLPLMIVISMLFRMRMRKSFRQMREAQSTVNARISETITGMNIIQLYNREKIYNRKFKNDSHTFLNAAKGQVQINSFFNMLISFVRFSGMGIIIYFGSRFVVGGALSLGTLIIFISYLEKFFQPIQDIAEKINIMQNAMASSERIFQLFDEKIEENPVSNTITFEDLVEKESEYFIEFQNVTFSYVKGETVLKNFSLQIKKGESVALVGHTGCGKTTVISLLSNLYKIEEGRILINGVDLARIPLEVLRKLLGVVQQDVTLFSDTVKSNILLGLDDEQGLLSTVCDYTNCTNFIAKLPQGYDTVLSEEGMSLSFGERQLISFARVIAYDPSIFVLDEATSNIDTETELLIQDTLTRILENRTSIVIAHRLSTIKHCNRIIVMKQGEIIEKGTHLELLAREGYYYRLYLLQYKNQLESNNKR
jgi:ATP-binding cassette subfamily B multidrug efflux pump